MSDPATGEPARATSVVARIRRDGAAAGLASMPGGDLTPARVLELLRAASLADEPDERLRLADEAGQVGDLEVLDRVLAGFAPPTGLPFVGALGRRRLRALARDVGPRTASVGTVGLMAALLGEFGDKRDVDFLEVVASHPALTLHGATALARLPPDEARIALLRLLHCTEDAARVVVLDRLLPFVRLAVVRLGIVRDGFGGLSDEHAREIAPAVVDALRLQTWVDDDRVAPDVRAAARRIVAWAGGPDMPGG